MKADNDPAGFLEWRVITEEAIQPGDIVVVEGLSFGSIGRSHVLAGVWALWMMKAYEIGSTVFVVPPLRVKKWAVNNTKAKKKEIIAWASTEYPDSKKKWGEHEADALALAQIGIAAYNIISGIQELDEFPTHRRDILWNKKGDGVTQAENKFYFKGKHG